MARRPAWTRGRALAEPIVRPLLSTRRLTLEPYTLREAPAYAEMQGDAGTVEFLRWPVRTIEESHQHLLDRMAHDRLVYRDDLLALAVRDELGEYVGDASLQLRSVKGSEVELGWIVTPDARGLGLGVEMGRALLRLAFGAGMNIARAEIERPNVASHRVALALGMHYTRSITAFDPDREVFKQFRWYEISADEWRDE